LNAQQVNDEGELVDYGPLEELLQVNTKHYGTVGGAWRLVDFKIELNIKCQASEKKPTQLNRGGTNQEESAETTVSSAARHNSPRLNG